MIYAITKDSTGSVIEWGGSALRAPVGGETAHSMPDADGSDQLVIDTNKPVYTKVVAARFAAMTQAERDVVDNVAKHMKVFRYADPEEIAAWPDREQPPKNLNYNHGLTARLERDVVMVQGEVTGIDYYASAVVNADSSRTYSDLILRETHSYVRDLAGFALTRSILIEWMAEDDTVSPVTKTRGKTYSMRGSIREGKRRRSNIIDELEIVVAGVLLATEVVAAPTDPEFPAEMDAALNLGRAFLEAHQPEINVFVEGSTKTLHDVSVPAYTGESIQNAPASWMENVVPGLGVTIRTVILGALDIWS